MRALEGRTRYRDEFRANIQEGSGSREHQLNVVQYMNLPIRVDNTIASNVCSSFGVTTTRRPYGGGGNEQGFFLGSLCRIDFITS